MMNELNLELEIILYNICFFEQYRFSFKGNVFIGLTSRISRVGLGSLATAPHYFSSNFIVQLKPFQIRGHLFEASLIIHVNNIRTLRL